MADLVPLFAVFASGALLGANVALWAVRRELAAALAVTKDLKGDDS